MFSSSIWTRRSEPRAGNFITGWQYLFLLLQEEPESRWWLWPTDLHPDEPTLTIRLGWALQKTPPSVLLKQLSDALGVSWPEDELQQAQVVFETSARSRSVPDIIIDAARHQLLIEAKGDAPLLESQLRQHIEGSAPGKDVQLVVPTRSDRKEKAANVLRALREWLNETRRQSYGIVWTDWTRVYFALQEAEREMFNAFKRPGFKNLEQGCREGYPVRVALIALRFSGYVQFQPGYGYIRRDDGQIERY